MNETASIKGLGTTTVNLSFRVDNAEQLLSSNTPALPGLAGPNAIPGVFDLGTFDWGLPSGTTTGGSNSNPTSGG